MVCEFLRFAAVQWQKIGLGCAIDSAQKTDRFAGWVPERRAGAFFGEGELTWGAPGRFAQPQLGDITVIDNAANREDVSGSIRGIGDGAGLGDFQQIGDEHGVVLGGQAGWGCRQDQEEEKGFHEG